jgi:ABC-type Mn2+/Zn2+ transport system ATPase subunit
MALSIDILSLKLKHKTLLRDISLELVADHLTLIIGHNGADKSTLLKTSSGDLAPTHGSSKLNGKVSQYMITAIVSCLSGAQS